MSGFSRSEVHHFVKKLLSDANRRDVESFLIFYADQVDYFDAELMNKNFIRRDKKKFFSFWTTIDYQLVGDIEFRGPLDSRTLEVAFEFDFLVKNSKRRVSDRTRDTIRLQKKGNLMVMVDEKQTIIPRKEGKSR